MKKTKLKFLLLSLILAFSLISSKAEAFLFFDPGALSTQIINNVNATLAKVTTFYNKVVKTTLDRVKSLADRFKNVFKRKDTTLPGTKTIKESKIADIYDENSIKPAIKTLFFDYPSEQPRVRNLYEDKGREFFDDTFIEAFTSVRELEKQMIDIDVKIANVNTENSDAKDLNEGLNNIYKVNVATDELMMVVQELVAIKSQMVSARAIKENVPPLYRGEQSSGILVE